MERLAREVCADSNSDADYVSDDHPWKMWTKVYFDQTHGRFRLGDYACISRRCISELRSVWYLMWDEARMQKDVCKVTLSKAHRGEMVHWVYEFHDWIITIYLQFLHMCLDLSPIMEDSRQSSISVLLNGIEALEHLTANYILYCQTSFIYLVALLPTDISTWNASNWVPDNMSPSPSSKSGSP